MGYTIGADPEFIIFDAGRKVSARDTYSQFTISSGEVGYDGHSATGELRPKHARTPHELVCNIGDLILRLDEKLGSRYSLRGGHYQGGSPIGGHIHLGVSPTTKLVNSLSKVNDEFNLLFAEKDKKKRLDSGYGGSKDYKNQDWGMEYRGFPSWLDSPGMAALYIYKSWEVFKGTQNKVIEEYLNEVVRKLPENHKFVLSSNFVPNWRKFVENNHDISSALGLIVFGEFVEPAELVVRISSIENYNGKPVKHPLTVEFNDLPGFHITCPQWVADKIKTLQEAEVGKWDSIIVEATTQGKLTFSQDLYHQKSIRVLHLMEAIVCAV